MSKSISAREELQQTAAMLEQILEVMPDDFFTLRSLYETFLKLEEPEQALECLKRLDDGTRAAQNPEMITFVIHQYESIVEEMPELRKRIERLQELQTATNLTRSETPAKPSAQRKSDVDSEMALAWELFQDEQLSQEEYSNLLRDLTEMSSHTATGVPVTVLHILHDRNFSRFERLMTHLCQKSSVPIITLSQFEEREEFREVLPLNFISCRGALPFAQVGDDLLLAVLNPQDKELVRQAEELAHRRCHAYLVSPQEYDQRLAQIKKALTV
jgi:tetratricopeptide (TPR) repeat protein